MGPGAASGLCSEGSRGGAWEVSELGSDPHCAGGPVEDQ